MNRINKSSFVVSAIVLVVGFASIASAATTISTSISTEGSLTVTGTGTFGNNITVPAAYGFDVASAGQLNIGTTTATSIKIGLSGITTTFPGAVTISGPTLLAGTASTTGNFSVNGKATTTASSGNFQTEGSITIGPDGNAVARLYKGTCTLVANASIAASSTASVPCALSSGTVQSGDLVFVTLSTTTEAVAMNYIVAGAKASTTNSAYLDVKLLNLTGGAAIPAATAGFGSSTQYLIIR